MNIAIFEAANDRHLGPLYRPIVGTVRAAKQALTMSILMTFQALLQNFGSVLVLYPIRGAVFL
jgi:hypothetical protein